MGWTYQTTEQKSIKAAFEDLRTHFEYGLTRANGIGYVIEDYRIRNGMMTLLVRNRVHFGHREIVCYLVGLETLTDGSSEFSYKELSVKDGFYRGFPMIKTWAKRILAERDVGSIEDGTAKAFAADFNRKLAACLANGKNRSLK